MSHDNHIQAGAGDVGRYVLLPGDPARAELIARRFDGARLIASSREFTTYTGALLGEKVSVTSTGIGCPSTAIAVEELVAIGADTLIRVGTCGGMQPNLALGDLVVGTAAIRDEGTSRQYLPYEYPAVADLSVTNALVEAARNGLRPVHTGVVHSKDSFYGQQQAERMPIAEELQARWTAWQRGGALCSEMEAATLFIVAGVLGKRAGALLMLTGNQERSPEDLAADQARGVSVDGLIDVAIEAVKVLIEREGR